MPILLVFPRFFRYLNTTFTRITHNSVTYACTTLEDLKYQSLLGDPHTLADLTNFILKGVNRSYKMDHALIFFLPLGWFSYLPSALNSQKYHYFSPMKLSSYLVTSSQPPPTLIPWLMTTLFSSSMDNGTKQSPNLTEIPGT